MPSVMSGSRFANVPSIDTQRSQFNRNHGYKTTFDAGWLVPFYVDEALPGDTFNLRMSGFTRLATPLKPLMDNLYLETFFFAVPYRLVWQNWERFNGAQDDPTDSIDYTLPQQTIPGGAGYLYGCVQDYFGLPTNVGGGASPWGHTCLPTRAYYLIYNEWFRDQNLQESRNNVGDVGSGGITLGNGPDIAPTGGCPLVRRGKRHDYFTSCLPWPQKGPAVELALGEGTVVPSTQNSPTFAGKSSSNISALAVATGTDPNVSVAGAGWLSENLEWADPSLSTQVTSTTINSMREAFQIQKLLERDARSGTRYTEIIKAHFGVTSPDARLQRPEYLGGGSTPIVISPVAQTSAGDTQPTPQGNLAAIGTGSFQGHGFVKSFTEHCILIGMVSARADLTYQQGIDRMWSRETRYDFYWPAFQGLGEQEVKNKEIYVQGTTADEDIFGYQERYAEYRYKPSKITGKFRSIEADTLDIWHLSQEFSALPTLGNAFIEDDSPVDRVIAVNTEPHFLFDSYLQLTCARPMPVYGVPGLIDHF